MERPAVANLRRMRILFVDNDLNSLEVTLKWLTRQHQEVFCFLRAGDALGMLRKGDAAVDLIMVDVRVPGEKSDKDANFLIVDIYREFGRRFPIVALSDVPGASATLEKDLEGAYWIMMNKQLEDKNIDILTTFVSSHSAANLPGYISVSASPSGQKRKKHLWNDELHQSFLRAADGVGGLEAAKPNDVLQRMLEEGRGFEGLTRHQVASHLQIERKKAKVVEN